LYVKSGVKGILVGMNILNFKDEVKAKANNILFCKQNTQPKHEKNSYTTKRNY